MKLGLSRLWPVLPPRLSALCRSTLENAGAIAHRIREAARDASRRLKTGRPRGMPSTYVHPPLECSKGCSQAARRVHGLLYGYSLAYQEVRPRAETIAQALGYGKSTTYNAIAELRRDGLLVVHERRGRDQRRIANRYDVIATPARDLLELRKPPSGSKEGDSEAQKTRRQTINSPESNQGTTIANAPPSEAPNRRRPGLASRSRRQAVAVSEERLSEVIGEECVRLLRSAFGETLASLRLVMAEQNALERPHLLRSACEALIKQHQSIDRPAGYLLGILRRQRDELDGMQQELLELQERHRQACMFDDPNQHELATQIERLQTYIAEPKAGAVSNSEGRERAKSASPRAVPPTKCQTARRPPTASPDSRKGVLANDDSKHAEFEQTVLRLKRTNLRAARIVAQQLDPAVAARLLAEEGREFFDGVRQEMTAKLASG